MISALGLADLTGARLAETVDSKVGTMVGSGAGVADMEGLGDGI